MQVPFDPEDKGSVFPQNVTDHISNDMSKKTVLFIVATVTPNMV
jgi:hypothetical protein